MTAVSNKTCVLKLCWSSTRAGYTGCPFNFASFLSLSRCAASPMLTGRGHISYGPLPLKEHLQCNNCILVHKVIHNKSPPSIWDSVSTLERAATIVHGTAVLFCPKQELTFIRWVLLILDPFLGMRYLEVLRIACSVSTFKSKALQRFRTKCNI